MDYDHESASLAAETLALQAVIAHVLHQVGLSNPTIAEAIRTGLNDAANEIEGLAIQVGKGARPDHLTKAISVVEQLRTMALGRRDRPKHGV